jgi:hypothetical protein
LLNGGSGEIPEPTVKVWMGEGKKAGLKWAKNSDFKPLFHIAFLMTLKLFSSGSFLFLIEVRFFESFRLYEACFGAC